MTGGRFDPTRPLILIDCGVSGPRGQSSPLLALDTGSSETLLTPDVVDELGYSARDGVSFTSITSAIGDELGCRLRVRRFEALGFGFANFMIHVHDLPSSLGIKGLHGLSFLRRFNYEIRSAEGRILLEELTR